MKKVKMFLRKEVESIPGFLLWRVSKLWQQKLEFTFEDLGLSHTQAILLINIVRLKQEENTVTQIMLAEITYVDPVTTSQAIKVLEKKKLIKRITAKNDKRAYNILPTEKGIQMTKEAIQRLPEVQKTFFQPISEDIENFITSLQKLLKEHN